MNYSVSLNDNKSISSGNYRLICPECYYEIYDNCLNTVNYNLSLSMIDEYNRFNDFKSLGDKISNCSDIEIKRTLFTFVERL